MPLQCQDLSYDLTGIQHWEWQVQSEGNGGSQANHFLPFATAANHSASSDGFLGVGYHLSNPQAPHPRILYVAY